MISLKENVFFSLKNYTKNMLTSKGISLSAANNLEIFRLRRALPPLKITEKVVPPRTSGPTPPPPGGDMG